MYERASDEKKSMLKGSIEKKEAELAKLPSKRELNVIKAQDNLELRQAEATLARTKATQLRQHLQAVQNSRYISVRDIDNLRRKIESASASETTKGQEVKLAKERLAKAEDYLKKGQAATQGQKSGLPSLDAVQPAPPTATKQPKRLQEVVPAGTADNLGINEGDDDEVGLDTVYPLRNQLIRIYTGSQSLYQERKQGCRGGSNCPGRSSCPCRTGERSCSPT